ncbi:type II CAAX prenyl endopeptidase Rce1 family protein [Streptomyces sp. Rer75]|uniref:CPBP family glutamic-type intramembrane protease n=1 Tax=unclassified Streptomyces TaxID=2593676 RepID=UPI0015CFCEF6|nr:CPBP family glutamic-type intramembrane protease [Streptomyces sp. Rer75]QLH20175.1 CPBP family intramembrane metalloprotease [Streptomyces sp. Rer75]
MPRLHPAPTASPPAPPTAPSAALALGRALLGGLVMAVALGVGTGVGAVVGAGGFAGRLVPAALVSSVAVPVVWLLMRRAGRPVTSLGFGGARASARAFLTGAGVTAGAAALVLGAGTAAGMLRWSAADPLDLARFLISNAVVALLLEALPEETTLRGYAWSSLRQRFRGAAAALGTTGVFLLVPGASTVAHAMTARLLGGEPGPIGWAPDGQNPVDYLILLTVFGLTLVAARTAVRQAPLWAAIGTHLTFLTVNRIALDGDRRDTGWPVEATTPDAVLLVPAYLLVAAAGFALCRWAARGSWARAAAGQMR